MNLVEVLEKKIKNKEAHLAVIGLGYVGLPLALSFARSGLRTTGIDIDKARVAKIKKGVSYIDDVADSQLREARKKHRFDATTDFATLGRVDCAIICVPTPLGKTKQPDLTYVMSAVQAAAKSMRKGSLLVLESTTYPGTTEENLLPIVQKIVGGKVEEDFFLSFSPERVDPGNAQFNLSQIPKVVGGMGPKSSRLACALYSCIFKEVIPVSSTKTAEMVKLLENTFRSVNIGLINEMAMMCHTLGIDIWEVIHAAKTKPFGFMPFYPGPGIGGHCINIDPMYLAWKARVHGYEPRMIELAQSINDAMPKRVVERAVILLNRQRKAVRGSKFLIIGMAYKKNVMDTRESPSIFVAEELIDIGAQVSFHDPHVKTAKLRGKMESSKPLTAALLKSHDLVLILTDHDKVDYRLIADSKTPVFDTRNAMKGYSGKQIVRL